MPLVVGTADTSVPPITSAWIYTTISAVRAVPGVSSTFTDSQILTAIQYADILVDSFINGGFPQSSVETRIFYDVRNWPLFLPKPFRQVTEVKVDSFVLPAAAYNVTKYGLELNWGRLDSGIAVDPFFYQSGYGPRNSHGSTVSISATWGWDSVPSAVALAASILAAEFLNTGNNDTGTIGGIDVASLDQRITGIAVEGFSLSLSNTSAIGTNGVMRRTTGDARVDRLLQAYRSDRAGVL